ncbi:hypothetical protein FB567DRAFT_348486 [Paraphoma chrysanthemicola]|uniref:Uncharacterized protein n=1 Tax=Paraphoma chrysanthemicola TaxID=798071 RepID=A0A8K0R8K4_9PLEO|nr:hypothetical protein FB567DRAFT_348486 [Paraphoma chrysanthemicola]
MPHILPPELRDMVYDYVLGPATEQHIRPTRRGARRRQIDEMTRDIVPHPNERIWMIGYNDIGIRGFDWGRQDILQGIVARELTEQWYQRHPFLFYAEELYLLSDFLDRAFALRIKNLRNFIKDIKIQIWDEDKPALNTLSSDLQCLKEVKNKDLKLSFDLWPTDEKNTERETLRLFLRLLNTAVDQLRGYGFHRIDVSWMRPQQDITCLFNLGDEHFEVVLAQIELGFFGARSTFDIIEHLVAWCE